MTLKFQLLLSNNNELNVFLLYFYVSSSVLVHNSVGYHEYKSGQSTVELLNLGLNHDMMVHLKFHRMIQQV